MHVGNAIYHLLFFYYLILFNLFPCVRFLGTVIRYGTHTRTRTYIRKQSKTKTTTEKKKQQQKTQKQTQKQQLAYGDWLRLGVMGKGQKGGFFPKFYTGFYQSYPQFARICGDSPLAPPPPPPPAPMKQARNINNKDTQHNIETLSYTTYQ